MFQIIPGQVLVDLEISSGWSWRKGPRILPGVSMKLASGFLLLWLSLGVDPTWGDPSPEAEESYSDWGLRHIRGSFESVTSYFDSFQELLGGKNGVCQYRCRYGEYKLSLPIQLSLEGPRGDEETGTPFSVPFSQDCQMWQTK